MLVFDYNRDTKVFSVWFRQRLYSPLVKGAVGWKSRRILRVGGRHGQRG